jgi:MGT family glycosyltransferase
LEIKREYPSWEIKFVPQLEVLKRANVFISHGGMNSVSEALYYNVPLVIIPMSANQPFVAYRVSELGAGIFLPKEKINAESLKASVETILHGDNYYENAKKISESFKEAGLQKSRRYNIRI